MRRAERKYYGLSLSHTHTCAARRAEGQHWMGKSGGLSALHGRVSNPRYRKVGVKNDELTRLVVDFVKGWVH